MILSEPDLMLQSSVYFIDGRMSTLSLIEGNGLELRAGCGFIGAGKDFVAEITSSYEESVQFGADLVVEDLIYSYAFLEQTFSEFFLKKPFGLLDEQQIKDSKFYIVNRLVDHIDILLDQLALNKKSTVMKHVKVTLLDLEGKPDSACTFIGIQLDSGWIEFSMRRFL